MFMFSGREKKNITNKWMNENFINVSVYLLSRVSVITKSSSGFLIY